MDQTTEQTTAQPDVQTTTTVLTSDQTQTQTQPQEQTVDFKSLIPKEYQGEKSLQNFQDMNGFVKSYLSAQRLVGLDKIAIPNHLATDDDWDQVYQKLGRPNNPNEYKYNLPQESKLDDNSLKAFSEHAHKLGLLPKQADGIINYYNELANASVIDANSKAETSRLEAEKNLRQEFGPAYNNKINAARNLASATLGDDFLSNTILADGSKLGDNSTVVKAFANLASKLSEDTIVKGDSPSYMTTSEIEKQIASLTQPNSPYWSKQHPNHAQAVKEVFELNELKVNS